MKTAVVARVAIVIVLHGHCKAVTLTVHSRHRSTANHCNLVQETAVVQEIAVVQETATGPCDTVCYCPDATEVVHSFSRPQRFLFQFAGDNSLPLSTLEAELIGYISSSKLISCVLDRHRACRPFSCRRLNRRFKGGTKLLRRVRRCQHDKLAFLTQLRRHCHFRGVRPGYDPVYWFRKG